MTDPAPLPPRLLFFANSSRDSTDGRRVREFRKRVPCTPDSTVLYRDEYGKLRSILVLLREARRMRPHLIYVELFAYSGLIGAIVAKVLWGCKIGVGNGDDIFSTHWKDGRSARAVVSGALDLFLRRYADLWAVWSPYYRRWLRRRGVRNVVCVPGAVNLDEIAPVDATELRRQLGLNGHLVVGVVGNLQYNHKLDMVYGWDLIEALAELRELPVKALLVGAGSGVERLRQQTHATALDNKVIFCGRVPHEELAAYYSLMDVGLATLSNDRDAQFTWTAKLPEYMACNVFPVTTTVERSRRFVTRCGALLPFEGMKDPAYPRRLARLLRHLIDNPAALQRRRHGRELARTHVSFEVAARHLERGIRRALATP
jgi:glycosyltransferase involved in cell wall biosynthesis